MIPKLQLFNVAESEKIKICGYSTHKYNIRPGKSICTTPTIDKLKAMVELHRKCAKLISEGKIDVKTRIRNNPLLAMWMVSMALYTKILRDVPEKVDKLRNRFINSKVIDEDIER